jgi:hypothetical protein
VVRARRAFPGEIGGARVAGQRPARRARARRSCGYSHRSPLAPAPLPHRPRYP